MKLELSNKDLLKVKKLIEVKWENIAVADLFNQIMNNNITFDNSVDQESILKEIAEIFEMDTSDNKTNEILNNQIRKSFKETSLDIFKDNKYKNVVKPQEISIKSTKLEYLNYLKNSLIPLNDITVDSKDYFREYSNLGFIKEEYQYLSLTKNNKIWMCIIPNEILTMDPFIKQAKGEVITFGLGLGYFPFMVALKPEVNKVTIIEKDNEVINLFNKYILPFFPHKEKIKIIADDAFSYLNKNKTLTGYDYAMFDLWHNAEDGLPIYYKLQKMDFHCKVNYWLEESIIALYRRCFIELIEENLNNYKASNYRNARNDIDAIINKLYFKTINKTFASFDEIVTFCEKDSLVKTIKN